MDAAHYITTLECVAPRASAPETYDYAILELAASDNLLEQIYSAMSHERLQWWSLFEGTEWQDAWENGPVLVDLRSAADFRRQLLSQLESAPLGVVFESELTVETLRQNLAARLCGSQAGAGHLLRFYEPRMIAPLLSALVEQKRQALLVPGCRWYWHDGHGWRGAVAIEDGHCGSWESEPMLVTQQELREAEVYWVAGEACGYADHYAKALTSVESPKHWVFNCLQSAREAGFQKTGHLERWLRLAIQHGADFSRLEPFRSTLSRDDLALTERLTAMESTPEKSHANA